MTAKILALTKVCSQSSWIFVTSGGICWNVGVNLRKGEHLLFWTKISVHKNKACGTRYFSHPDRFDPDRWDRSVNKKRLPGSAFASMPFGFGTRRCIGKHIAEYSMQALVSQLLGQCEMTSTDGQDVKYIMKLIGVPDRNLDIEFRFFWQKKQLYKTWPNSYFIDLWNIFKTWYKLIPTM